MSANTAVATARLSAFYLSRDRVLSLLEPQRLPGHVLAALQGRDEAMATAILSNVVGSYLLNAIASGSVKTLQQLAFEDAVRPGAVFIYDGHCYGKGFAYRNKSPALTLTEKLDEPLEGRNLIFEFAKDGLVNATAYTRMAGSTRLFAFGYITHVDSDNIRAAPYIVGDLVEAGAGLPVPFAQGLELQPDEIAQFAGMDRGWSPGKAEFDQMRNIPESTVKELICNLLGEVEVPADWGGEESDLFSCNLMVGGDRMTGAFLLKGPAKFHPMTPRDLGKNGDQLYRLFNTPAQVFVVQHCHSIGPAVRKTAEAFALNRAFIAPCRLVFLDGWATAQLLRAHGRWPKPKTRSTAA
ncbi:methyltransferase [Paraburkholderia sediminicola]|uniref:methyltransferase n=1 Tax=Paraburkholderia sediminicola TaxID=458836 RepID=UPI0038BC4D5C